MSFTLHKTDLNCRARRGTLTTAHGPIETPIFMPVGTRGAVKTLTERHLHEIGAQIILGNTYHLFLRPGMDVIQKAGGLHQFIGWDLPILTDSGGFQVFSLTKLRKMTDEGVTFQSHIDGQTLFLGPKESMEIQKILGSDIVMAFDECVGYPATRLEVEESLKRTHCWAEACRAFSLQSDQLLFGIVQGGMYEDLRQKSAETLRAMDFDGYAVGGVSVGEPMELGLEVVSKVTPHLPEEKARYLMGVGTPADLVEAVYHGIDMFDCVMPSRNARNGTAYTWQGKINIKAGRYREDFSPLDDELDCYASKFSKAYIRHLLNVDEITGLTLVTMQNLAFYLDLMAKMRQAIDEDRFLEFRERVHSIYPR